MSKPVYVVCGTEAYLRAETLKRIIREQLGPDDSFGPTRYEGDKAELADVLDEVRTFSLLGDIRVVVVEDADGFITRNREALEKYVASPSDSGKLILSCTKFPATTRLHKAVKKVGEVIKCEPPKRREIAGWITKQAQQVYSKKMHAMAAARLRDLIGDSLGQLDSELSKLAIYVEGRPEIRIDDIEALVGDNREESVFAVLDAIANGDVSTALHHWERVLATDRSAPGRAIGGLAYGVRKLLSAKRDADAGTPVFQLARQFFVDANVMQRRLNRVSAIQLEDQLSDLLAADVDTKVGRSDVGRAIEKFIIRHAATDRRTARVG